MCIDLTHAIRILQMRGQYKMTYFLKQTFVVWSSSDDTDSGVCEYNGLSSI